MDSETKVKCSKVRKCKWKGTYGEMIDSPIIRHKFYFKSEVTEKCCPKCGHNEFYEEEDNARL